jgi:hypothetical protein
MSSTGTSIERLLLLGFFVLLIFAAFVVFNGREIRQPTAPPATPTTAPAVAVPLEVELRRAWFIAQQCVDEERDYDCDFGVLPWEHQEPDLVVHKHGIDDYRVWAWARCGSAHDQVTDGFYVRVSLRRGKLDCTDGPLYFPWPVTTKENDL